MAKPKTSRRAAENDDAESTTVLIAGTQIHGGTDKERASLAAGRELTPEKAAALGLDEDSIAELVRSGVLIERKARVASEGAEGAALQAATARADKAEQENAELRETIAELTARLEKAEATSKPAD